MNQNGKKNRYEYLTLIGEKCLVTFYHVLYPKRIAITYDKKVWPRVFLGRRLDAKRIMSIPSACHRKWALNYKCFYMVKNTFIEEAIILSSMDGIEFWWSEEILCLNMYFILSNVIKK